MFRKILCTSILFVWLLQGGVNIWNIQFENTPPTNVLMKKKQNFSLRTHLPQMFWWEKAVFLEKQQEVFTVSISKCYCFSQRMPVGVFLLCCIATPPWFLATPPNFSSKYIFIFSYKFLTFFLWASDNLKNFFSVGIFKTYQLKIFN